MNVRDEEGQALLLALAFLTFFGLVIGAMLAFAGASVRSTERLREQRSTVYAADGATDAAIQLALTNSTVGAYADPRCQATIPTAATGQILLTTTATTTDATVTKVICTWSQDQFQPERTVTFSTFAGGGSSPVVQATVLFHDTQSPVTVNVLSWTYCGHSTSC
jgi:Tfp pilus assembly protein PilX